MHRCPSTAGMVQKYMGSAFDIVKEVTEHLDIIIEVGGSLVRLLMYCGAFGSPPTKRVNGDPLQEGDYYLNTTNDQYGYYIGGTWKYVDPAVLFKAKEEAVQAAANAKVSETSASASATNAHTSEVNSKASEVEADKDRQSAEEAARAAWEAASLLQTLWSNGGPFDASSGVLPTAPNENTSWLITVGGTLPNVGEVTTGGYLYWYTTAPHWYYIPSEITQVQRVYTDLAEAIASDNTQVLRIKLVDTGFEYVKSAVLEPLGFTDNQGIYWTRVEDLNTTITRRVTSTMHYSAWTQDKAFVYDDCIYVPYMEGVTHDTTTTSIMMIKSYDGGCTWSLPEMLIKNTNAVGYYSMNAGVLRGRFIMLVGEWPTSGSAHSFYMYSKPLDRMDSLNGIFASTAGSATITVTIPKHGLFTDDVVFFSGVKNVSFPISGKYTVTQLDEDRFTVEAATAATTTGTGLGGTSIKFSTLWDAQPFRREKAPQDVLGHAVDNSYPTHIHSTVTYDDNTLVLGFHHGGVSPREAGIIVIDNFFADRRTWFKRRLPTQYEGHQQEPSIAKDNQGRIHLLCRWSGQGSDMSSYAWTEDKGVTWNCSFFKGLPKVYGTDWPMVIKDDVMYCFGAQRRPNEDTPDVPTYYQRGYTALYMLQASVSELVTEGASAITSKKISHCQYGGELSSSAAGVGSVIEYKGTLRYYYGSEDFCEAGMNADNGFANLDPYKNSGINADIWELQVNLEPVTTNVSAFDASGTKREEHIYKRDGRYINETPLSFEDASVKFQNGGQPVFQSDAATDGLKTMTIANNNGVFQIINRPDNNPLSGGTSLMRSIVAGGTTVDWELLSRRYLMNIPAISGRVAISSSGTITLPRKYGIQRVVKVEDGVFRVEFPALATAHYCVSVTPVTNGATSVFAMEQDNRADSVTFRFVDAEGIKTTPDGFTFTITLGGA